MDKKIIATNRKARFEYNLLEHYEAGIVLLGTEIKSIRARQASIAEAYVQIDGEEVWLINSHIPPYDPASRMNHDPKRKRKLLLNKREINQLWNGVRQKGLTIVPVEVYLKNGKAKMDIALARGKKIYDKRRDIADRDMKRDLERNRKI
ncbi:MAG: SsrA-binding protein SmpB [Anaerolineaceae bacterium]|jgi:SsrA-binding protein|nr:MAG: SsrA-binding protein SmpB [Anaerolineaceae bacterium]